MKTSEIAESLTKRAPASEDVPGTPIGHGIGVGEISPCITMRHETGEAQIIHGGGSIFPLQPPALIENSKRHAITGSPNQRQSRIIRMSFWMTNVLGTMVNVANHAKPAPLAANARIIQGR